MNVLMAGHFSLLLLSLSLTGCSYTRVITHIESAPQTQKPPQLSEVKVSYNSWDLRQEWLSENSSKTVSTALLDVLHEYGIQDVVQSDKYEPDRLNISIYELESDMTWGSRFIGFPLGMIASMTCFILPAHLREVYPIEVHIVDPEQSGSRRLTIIRSSWTQSQWMWLGFAFFAGGPLGENSLITGHSRMDWREAIDSLHVSTLRSSLRPILRKVLHERAKT
jgi:hypothetical protein